MIGDRYALARQWGYYENRPDRPKGTRVRQPQDPDEVTPWREVSTKIPEKPFPFLKLPPELRLDIYERVYNTTHRVHVKVTSKLDPANKNRRWKVLGHAQMWPRNEIHAIDKLRLPPKKFFLGLTYSCKQLYAETRMYLYTQTQFVFSSPKAIEMFLAKTTTEAKNAVQSLEIRHVTYGEPKWTADREWKLKSDTKWNFLCTQMAEAFNLRELYIDLKLCDWPIHLEIDEGWVHPMLEFGRYKVEYAKILLNVRRFPAEKVLAAERAIEKALMSDENFREKELEDMLKTQCISPARIKAFQKDINDQRAALG